MYTKLQIFIQLSPTLRKLCHARLPISHDTLKMTLDHDGHKQFLAVRTNGWHAWCNVTFV